MNVNIQTPMFQYSVYLSKEAISCLEYLLDNQGNVIVFADSYDIGPTGSLNFYRISYSDGKNIKIPIYSVPSNCWISVVLVTEDQRQVLFEEDPSFEYEFDDLDFIRNRNLKNPLFQDNIEHNQSSFYSETSDNITQNNHETNSGIAPVINIQNILPENMGQQTVVNSNDNNNNGRVSITDEQMNGLLSSIDKLTNLFVQQQSNFNLSLEIQGQQLLQLQPLILKLLESNNVQSNTNINNENKENKENKNTLQQKSSPSLTLNDLLNNFPKSFSPLMPNLYSGTSLNLTSEAGTLPVEKKSIDTSKLNKPNNIDINEQSISTQQNEKNDIEKINDNDNINQTNSSKHQILDLNKEKASSIDELLFSLENEKSHTEPTLDISKNDLIMEDIGLSDNDDNDDNEENLDIQSIKHYNSIEDEEEKISKNEELSDEDLAVLNEINQAIPNEDLSENDIKNLVSAIDVIQTDEEDFANELKDIIDETNELINNKDVLHFRENINNYNPSGALENEEEQEDLLSRLSSQAENILSRKDEYSDKELLEFEKVNNNKPLVNDVQDEEDNDELLYLFSSINNSSQHVDFEPIPDDEDEDDNKGSEGESSHGSFSEETNIQNYTEENTNSSNVNNYGNNSTEMGIHAILDDDDDDDDEKNEHNNKIINDTSNNVDSEQSSSYSFEEQLNAMSQPDNIVEKDNSNYELSIEEQLNAMNNNAIEDDLSLLDEAIAKKSGKESFNFKPEKSEDDFSLDELDNLEALIEPPSKKTKTKTKFTADDSDNQDEFVSSQILSYVFSDLDEDTHFEVKDFLEYFEVNNLHKAFGKINKDRVIYLVCKLLKNKNASPSKFVRPSIQKKLKSIMPDVAKEHWTGSISNIMDVFEEEKLLDDVNEIDICVWFVKNNFF